MSRWIETFENHAFQAVWQQIKEAIVDIVAVDETVVTDVKEIARLKKVIVFVDELINAADPEMLPTNTWDQFHGQMNNCLAQIHSFQQNKNITHIQNANANLDNILTYIRPYVVSGKSAAQAAGSAFKAYSESVNMHIKTLEESAKNAVSNAQDNKVKTDSILAEIQTSKDSIYDLEVSFLTGDENEKSLREKMNALFDEATEWHTKIDEFYEKLTSGDEQESAIILQIEKAKDKAIKNSSFTREALESSRGLISELKEFYSKIFGEENKDGEIEGGLKQELDVRRKEIISFKEDQEEKYKAILEEIETLLPGATSAGLATAYRELRDSFDAPIKHYSKLFYSSLVAIFIAAVILIIDKVGLWHVDFVDIADPLKLFNNIFYKLPIMLPLLWLAIFSSKRRSEDRRLQQEYAHKEAMAKSYQSFKKQVEDLKTDDNALMQQLLEKAIAAISFNASTTLDGKHGDKLPLESIIEKAISAAVKQTKKS